MHIPDREKFCILHFTVTSGWPRIVAVALSRALILRSVRLLFIVPLLIYDCRRAALGPRSRSNRLELAPRTLESGEDPSIGVPDHANHLRLKLQHSLTENGVCRQLQLRRKAFAERRRLRVGCAVAP